MSAPITVSILGKDYQIACPSEEQNALRESAKLLNNKMLEIRGSGKVVGVDRIAVMAGLNITHDLLAENKKKNGITLNFSEKVNALQNKLDFAIDNFSK